jgi:sialidase-1
MTTSWLTETVLFRGSLGGYDTYRIPAIIVAPGGAVLAFCEGRRESASDSGAIDILLRRSLDGGETFGPVEVIAADEDNTVGNPCPVVDRDTGVIWLLLTRNLGRDDEGAIIAGASEDTRRVWAMRSADDGATWSAPADITETAKAPDWTWYATGPGVGIQTRSGRLVIPCDHSVTGPRRMQSHVIYSDDHGESWHVGGASEDNTDECQVAELRDGRLMLNMRSYHGRNRRAIATSDDGGLTWSPIWFDETLIEPVCQASLLRYDGADGPLVFSNPASIEREKMTLRLSYDDGATWPIARTIYEGPAAYSCLTVLPDGRIGCLYERGVQHAYEEIALARCEVGWVKERE